MARGGATTRWRRRLTRQGVGVLGLSLFVGAAAYNTANNLLYLLLALLAGVLVVSWWLPSRSLRRVSGEVHPPPEVVAGEAADVAVALRSGAARGVAGLAVDVVGEESAGAVVPWLAPGGTAASSVRLAFPRRGEHDVALRLSTPFPFGTVETVGEVARATVLVLPRPRFDGRRPSSGAEGEGALSLPRRGSGAELFGIREWRSGDDARTLDWKATARRDRPMVREFAQEQRRRVVLAVDPGAPRPVAGPEEEELVEAVIARAAGAAEVLEAEGWTLKLVTPRTEVEGSARDVLRGLARLDMTPSRAGPRWWRRHVAAGDAVLCFPAPEAAS